MWKRDLCATVLGLTLALSGVAPAHSQQTPSAAQKHADDYYKKQEWADAARAYEEVTKQEPQNGRAWYRLGSCRQHLQHLPGAIEAYQKAESIGHNPLVMVSLGG